jgi:alcohol dehydrogenase
MQAWRYEDMLAMILSGRLNPSALIGARLSLDEAVSVLVEMDKFADKGIQVIEKFTV